MPKNKTFGFIGAGNMAETLLSGLIASGQAKPGNITCSDVRPQRLRELTERYGIQTTSENRTVIQSSAIVIYAGA